MRMRGEFFTRAILRRERHVIDRVVLVICERTLDRVEVEHVRMHACHMIKMRANACEITAPELELLCPHIVLGKKVSVCGNIAPRLQRAWCCVMLKFRVEICTWRETIDEDLIDDSTCAPVLVSSCKARSCVGVEKRLHLKTRR